MEERSGIFEENEIKALNETELAELKSAKNNLEKIGSIMKGINKVGSGFESGIKVLPEKQQIWLSKNISNILFKILKSNINAIKNNKTFKTSSDSTFKALVGLSGIGSGFFGSFNILGSSIFISELYFSTRIMMRSILEIAKSEGENIYEIETQLACIQVFALGGNSTAKNAAKSPYYSTREAMANALESANNYLKKNGVEGLEDMSMYNTNPVLMMIGLIATRLTIQITEKFISRAVPIIGAASGGALNYFYIEHYQKIARAHFIVRRLERENNKDIVKKAYNTIII
tara:strand:+ start:30696 stop:31559 length:864 start_codon:yes stop_codon:yes gene_type:complete